MKMLAILQMLGGEGHIITMLSSQFNHTSLVSCYACMASSTDEQIECRRRQPGAAVL